MSIFSAPQVFPDMLSVMDAGLGRPTISLLREDVSNNNFTVLVVGDGEVLASIPHEEDTEVDNISQAICALYAWIYSRQMDHVVKKGEAYQPTKHAGLNRFWEFVEK